MAGLGIGLTLAGSGMMMTGCTEIPVTDAQVDKVFTALDNANKFMEETKDILNKQNVEIGNIVLEMEKQNVDQLYGNIVRLYNHSVRRIQLNLDNVWDNMKVSMSASI